MADNIFQDLKNSSLGKILTNSSASMGSAGMTQTDYDAKYQATFGGSNSDNSFTGALSSGLSAGISGAIPVSVKQDVMALSDFRLGTFLRRRGVVNGNVASIIDGSIDFLRSNKTTTAPAISKFQTYSNKFIPVILKTEFDLDYDENSKTNKPLYIVFDTTPESFSFSRTATWTPKDFLGRPDPVQIFGGNSAISFNLRGLFFSDRPQDHAEKIKLSDKLFALVTPSKKNFIPSPVYVRIGEWKTLRCVTTNVTVEYKGPWWTSPTENASQGQDAIVNSGVKLPSYTPYVYEASFTFTVVPTANNVKYAEDIISTGKFEPSIKDGVFGNDLGNLIKGTTTVGQFKNITGAGTGANTGIQDYQYTVNIPDSYITSIQNAYTAIGNDSRLSGVAQITAGLSGIVQQNLGSIISKSNFAKYIK